MPIWLWIVVAICIILTAGAVVAHALRPKQFEPLDLEFDMRAVKRVQQETEQERKIARTRELAQRQYSTSKTQPGLLRLMPARAFIQTRTLSSSIRSRRTVVLPSSRLSQSVFPLASENSYASGWRST